MKALIIVDYINQWINKKSDYYVGNISKQIKNLNEVIGYCRDRDTPIIFTTHIELKSEKDFVKGTRNVEIIPKVDYKEGKDTLIRKNKISPFYKTQLEKKLDKLGAKELIIAGISTNLCVRSLISDAYDKDYKITVIKDCCIAFSDELQEFTFEDLKNTRPEIEFYDTEEFIEK
ncbi:MAG: cysteine hydrolase [Candidatus Woesearchaeota archaeon]|nr:MAG: cysteine hydrolase [Candidatus Woesearchaeota archaeon]